MQSGITASKELLSAFQTLVSNPSQFGLLAHISKEHITPSSTIPSESNDFSDSLQLLSPLLKDHEAAYIILRRYASANDGFICITYIPDTAPVRQKMLFASTRLTLVRELGIERFRETIFVTTKAELSAEGFRKHDRHNELAAPLTKEEEELGAVKKAEAEEGRGMSLKKAHVNHTMLMPISAPALDALRALGEAGGGAGENLVQLKIDVKSESIELDSMTSATASSLSNLISSSEPRYSFYRHDLKTLEGSSGASSIIFIYTCPASSKIKERMVYASTRSLALKIAETEAGLRVEKKLEMSDPGEITGDTIEDEFRIHVETKKAFERPKRPGRK